MLCFILFVAVVFPSCAFRQCVYFLELFFASAFLVFTRSAVLSLASFLRIISELTRSVHAKYSTSKAVVGITHYLHAHNFSLPRKHEYIHIHLYIDCERERRFDGHMLTYTLKKWYICFSCVLAGKAHNPAEKREQKYATIYNITSIPFQYS